jgi:hypothetical protein
VIMIMKNDHIGIAPTANCSENVDRFGKPKRRTDQAEGDQLVIPGPERIRMGR